MTLELNMRADDAHSTQIDQKVFPLSKGELLTAPQAVFAEVLGRILAARWARPSRVGCQLRTCADGFTLVAAGKDQTFASNRLRIFVKRHWREHPYGLGTLPVFMTAS